MKSDSQKPNASNGSLAWSVSADEVSWILGEFAPYFTNYVMHSMFGVTEESYLFDFQDTGKLTNHRDRDTAGVWHRADGRRNFPDG